MTIPGAVLVHGLWHGAWCRDAVRAAPAERGVDSVAVELPLTDLPAVIAWRSVPSAHVVCAEDEVVHPERPRAMASRSTRTVQWSCGVHSLRHGTLASTSDRPTMGNARPALLDRTRRRTRTGWTAGDGTARGLPHDPIGLDPPGVRA